jgi:hypothetical protein
MSDTPETDAFRDSQFTDRVDEMDKLYDLAEKLERERDEARGVERIKEGAKCPVCSPEQKCWECADDVSREGAIQTAVDVLRERDEAIAARKASAADWRNQLDQMGKCVSSAKRMAALAVKERTEMLEALMKIEDVFVDGEDTYEGWRAMGSIAKAALEGKV